MRDHKYVNRFITDHSLGVEIINGSSASTKSTGTESTGTRTVNDPPEVVEESKSPFEADSEIRRLTKREIEVLSLRARGRTSCQIAIDLGISKHTVKNHNTNISLKLRSVSTANSVFKAIELGYELISDPAKQNSPPNN